MIGANGQVCSWLLRCVYPTKLLHGYSKSRSCGPSSLARTGFNCAWSHAVRREPLPQPSFPMPSPPPPVKQENPKRAGVLAGQVTSKRD
jgi:hypothetical protein